jgi:hypothetical protein
MSVPIEELKNIKKQVENMNLSQQLEILKIFHQENDVKINENKSGIYVNLTFLSKEVLDKINNYLKYVNDQETSLNIIEDKKENVKQEFFEVL